jgi:hypothetical protein
MPRNALHSFVLRISTAPVVAIFTVLAAFLLIFIQVSGLPFIPGFHTILRIGLPDMMLTYSPSKIYRNLTLFGPDGRLAYRLFLERVDSIFPAIYGIFFLTATTFGLARLFPDHPGLQQLSYLTLGTTVFDYAENICFLIFLRSYPQQLPVLAKFANIFTLIKWAFAAFSMTLVLILAALLLRSRRPHLAT